MVRKESTRTFFSHEINNELISEAAVQKSSVRKVFLEISQNSQENTCARISFLNKAAGLRPATLLKRRLLHRCFPVNCVKFLRTFFLTEHLWTTASASSPQLFGNIQEFRVKEYFTDHQTANTIQLLVAIKGIFSGLFFFGASCSKGEFPKRMLDKCSHLLIYISAK